MITCPSCQSPVEAETRCAGCGGTFLVSSERDALLSLAHIDEAMFRELLRDHGIDSANCPGCGYTMRQIQLRGGAINGCPGCGGMWCSAEDERRLLGQASLLTEPVQVGLTPPAPKRFAVLWPLLPPVALALGAGASLPVLSLLPAKVFAGLVAAGVFGVYVVVSRLPSPTRVVLGSELRFGLFLENRLAWADIRRVRVTAENDTIGAIVVVDTRTKEVEIARFARVARANELAASIDRAALCTTGELLLL